MRFEDERVLYLMQPESVTVEEVRTFISEHDDIDTMLCNIRYNEVIKIKKELLKYKNVHFDVSGFKDKVFAMPELRKEGLYDKARYGSMAPLFVLNSSVLIYNEKD